MRLFWLVTYFCFMAASVATAVPQVKLLNSGDACDATNEGAIFYESTENQFYFCADEASGWESLEDLTPASGGGGGGFLKVYDGDGTALGYLVDGSNPPDEYVIADLVTGEVYSNPYNRSISVGTVYFSSTDCRGSTYFRYNYDCGYGCTGAASCQTNLYCGASGGINNGSATYRSVRYANGTCQNTQSTVSGYYGQAATNPVLICAAFENCTIGP